MGLDNERHVMLHCLSPGIMYLTFYPVVATVVLKPKLFLCPDKGLRISSPNAFHMAENQSIILRQCSSPGLSAADSRLPPPAFSLRDFHKQHGLSGLIAATLGQISQSYYYPM